MEHAIWIKKSGEEQYVSIKKMKSDFGEDVARTMNYQCSSKRCGVKMITVFPKQIRHNGKETHADHFRASPKRHALTCGGDGEREAINDEPSGGESDVKRRHKVVNRSIYPMRYVKRPRVRQDVTDLIVDNDNKKLEHKEPKGLKVKGEQQDNSHTSKSETGHIRGIVEAYENSPEERSWMELRLPECPARNYEDAFVDVYQAVDKNGRAKGHYIYYGTYREHSMYGKHAISITFSCYSGDGRKLGIWIKAELEPDAKREEVMQLLARAARDKEATVYVFGRFQPFSYWKYSIEVEAFGDLWITFPINPGVSCL